MRLSQRSAAGTPFTAAQRLARDSAYSVQLAISGALLWSQNVFQLAHELTHVLCAVSPDAPALLYEHKNLWFEEAICHAAALHALHAFGGAALAALYPAQPDAMRDYAREHADADHVLVDAAGEADGKRAFLPHAWYRRHRRLLRDWRAAALGEQRRLQCAVSVWLLRRVGWRALAECCTVLNARAARCTAEQYADLSFTEYLDGWLRSCGDDAQRATVAAICAAFGRLSATGRVKRRKAR